MALGNHASPSFNPAVAASPSLVAPERDYFSEAPEVDRVILAPEPVPDSGLQVRDGQQPSLILYDSANASEKQVAGAHNTELKASAKARHHGLSRRSWALVLIMLILVLCLGLGLGLGLSLSKSHAAPVTSSPLPNLTHGVYNDSSFAAVTTPDATRHVFFQDINGTLRQVQFSTTTQAWATSLNFVIPSTTDARQNTPISAIILDDSSATSTPILLLYISQDYHLAATLFNYQRSQTWENATTFFNLSQYLTAPSSRSLEIVQIPGTNRSSELSLWFEDSNGGVVGLLGSHSPVLPSFNPTILDPFWSWADAMANLKANLSNTAITIDPPFTISPCVYYVNTSVPSVPFGYLEASFFIPNANPETNVLWADYANGTWSTLIAGFLTNLSEPSNIPFEDIAAIKASDWVIANVGDEANYNSFFSFPLWVNGSTLSIFGKTAGEMLKLVQTPPTSPFPYTRFAVTGIANSTALYLYHQLNETNIAEDVWDSSIQGWTSSLIKIAAS